MDDTRLPKQLLYGELCEGKRPRHKPKFRYKDCIKATLKKCKVNIDFWEENAQDKAHWRQLVSRGIEQYERDRKDHEKLKRQVRKQGSNVSCVEIGISPELACQECGRVCLSKAGLLSHLRSHNINPLMDCSNHGVDICYQCGKQCKSTPGLKRHMRIHGASIANLSTKTTFSCDFCGFERKSLAGKMSHMRAKYK